MKKQKNRTGNGLVFSTDSGKMCPGCDNPIAECTCHKGKMAPDGNGIVRVGRETKGRKGKGVTLITGVDGSPAELKKLCKQLKSKCCSGGTVKEYTIEIQGDHRNIVMEELKKQGWTVKQSGG